MTILQGVDYSVGRPRPAVLAAEGYQFAIRYLAYGSGANRKFLTKPEAEGLLAAGLATGLVFEVDEGRYAGGFSQGVLDGAQCMASVAALGAPENVAVFVAVDTDVAGNRWGVVATYFQGLVRGGIPLERLGAYGPGDLVEWLQVNGYVSLTWQAMAWNYDRTDDETFDVWQYDQGEVDGASVDFNRAYTTHWLWRPAGGLSVEDIKRIDRLERIVAGYGLQVIGDNGQPQRIGGEDALAYADQQQWSAFLGLGIARNDIGALAAAVAEYADEQGLSAGDVVDELVRRLQAGGVKP